MMTAKMNDDVCVCLPHVRLSVSYVCMFDCMCVRTINGVLSGTKVARVSACWSNVRLYWRKVVRMCLAAIRL